LAVAHFNHKLRGAESNADQEFVANLAREHDLEFYVDSAEVADHARRERVSVETAARELRYGFFRYLLGEDRTADPQGLKPSSIVVPNGTAEVVPFPNLTRFLDKIVTGHTLDDQAETVLMRMMRGSGLRGLGGIHPRIGVADDDGEVSGEIVRPLLTTRRRELEQYLEHIRQPWREDSTNVDARFTRNRVRKLVVPLLEQEFNPGVAEHLAELAEIARGEEDYWENEIAGWLGTTVHWSLPDWARAASQLPALVQIAPPGNSPAQDPDLRSHPRSDLRSDLGAKIDNAPWLVMNACVSRMWLLGEPIAVQRRLVKAIGENARIPLEFKHVEEILRIAAEDDASVKEMALPLGWKLVREPEELVFVTPDLRQPEPPLDYEYELPIPGQVSVYEAGYSIAVRTVPADAQAGYNPHHLLDAESLPGPLRVRNWRAGDRFWPAHTKSPKKIKELLQEIHVAQPERRSWPVVVSVNEIVWVRGFNVPAKLRAKPGRTALLIADTPLAGPMTEH
jgi:tRNA(Ile)-lysidine synthase